jgi:hypothetical protein
MSKMPRTVMNGFGPLRSMPKSEVGSNDLPLGRMMNLVRKRRDRKAVSGAERWKMWDWERDGSVERLRAKDWRVLRTVGIWDRCWVADGDFVCCDGFWGFGCF